jgi:hypothetical protein
MIISVRIPESRAANLELVRRSVRRPILAVGPTRPDASYISCVRISSHGVRVIGIYLTGVYVAGVCVCHGHAPHGHLSHRWCCAEPRTDKI